MNRRHKVITVSLAVLCAAALVAGIATGCTVVPPISGTVVDKNTGEPIPGALVKVKYSGARMSLGASISKTFAEELRATDNKGRFSVASKIIVVHPLTRFERVYVKVLHPFYARRLGTWLTIPKREMNRERCQSITFRLTRLEDYLATGPERIGLAFGCEEYFVRRERLHLPTDVDQTISYWQELAERFPGAKENIGHEIRRLQELTREYRRTSQTGEESEK